MKLLIDNKEENEIFDRSFFIRLNAELKYIPSISFIKNTKKYIPTMDLLYTVSEEKTHLVLERIIENNLKESTNKKRESFFDNKKLKIVERKICLKGVENQLKKIKIKKRFDFQWTEKEEKKLILWAKKYKCNFEIISLLLNIEFHSGETIRKRIDCVDKIKDVFKYENLSCECFKCQTPKKNSFIFKGLFYSNKNHQQEQSTPIETLKKKEGNIEIEKTKARKHGLFFEKMKSFYSKINTQNFTELFST